MCTRKKKISYLSPLGCSVLCFCFGVIVGEVNDQIERNLIEGKPPPINRHSPSGCSECFPPAADSEKKKVYSATNGHN